MNLLPISSSRVVHIPVILKTQTLVPVDDISFDGLNVNEVLAIVTSEHFSENSLGF